MSSQDVVDQFNTAFRDFVVDGVPSSGVNPPNKAQIRAIGPLVGALQGQFTRAALAAGSIAAAVLQVTTSGYAAAGDGGFGCYVRVVGQPTYPGSWFRSQDRFLPDGSSDNTTGGYWLLVPDARGVNARAFGAVADGVVAGDRSFSGTNNAPMIQAAIDYATYGVKCPCYIPAGVYLISDALQLGYGASTRSTTFEGDGPKYRGESSYSGTILLCNFGDRPGLAVNGQRFCRIRGLGLAGLNYGWIESQGYMGNAPLADDKVLANWIAAGLSNGRFNPYCAIGVDCYVGAQPSPHYPNRTFPAWSGIVAQYGASPSSRVIIEDCYVVGFVAVCAIQPCNDDANGDFVKFHKVFAEKCAYLFSAGNTQGRVFGAVDCSFNTFHTGYVNSVHGKQLGQFDFVSVNSDYNGCINIVDLVQAANAGPCRFVGGYSENVWRIGNWGTNERSTSPLSFTQYTFNLSGQNDARGWAPSVLTATDQARAVFEGCKFVGSHVAVFEGDAASYSFINCVSSNQAFANAYEKLATTFLANGLLTEPGTNNAIPEQFFVHVVNSYNVDTGGGEERTIGQATLSDRSHPIPANTRRAVPMLQPGFYVDIPPRWSAYNQAGAVACSITGKTLTLQFAPGRTDATFAQFGPLPGDVIYHTVTHSVFFVRSRTGDTILAELQNNYTFDGVSTYTLINAFDPAVGTMYFGNSRMFLPEYFLRGDTSTATAAIINCARDDGFGSWVGGDAQVLVNDYLYINEQVNRFFGQSASKVTAVASGDPSTITLNGNAARSNVRQLLMPFIRQPPANV